jgi:excisionase family DNA binding protein
MSRARKAPAQLIQPDHVCRRMNITPRQLERLVETGKLPRYKPTGSSGTVMFDPDDVDEYLRRVRIPATSGPLAEKQR